MLIGHPHLQFLGATGVGRKISGQRRCIISLFEKLMYNYCLVIVLEVVFNIQL
jgi:hypothetical protein